MSQDDAPNFKLVSKDNCIDCIYSNLFLCEVDTLWSSYVCREFDFRIPYPAANHVCDVWSDDFEHRNKI